MSEGMVECMSMTRLHKWKEKNMATRAH